MAKPKRFPKADWRLCWNGTVVTFATTRNLNATWMTLPSWRVAMASVMRNLARILSKDRLPNIGRV